MTNKTNKEIDIPINTNEWHLVLNRWQTAFRIKKDDIGQHLIEFCNFPVDSFTNTEKSIPAIFSLPTYVKEDIEQRYHYLPKEKQILNKRNHILDSIYFKIDKYNREKAVEHPGKFDIDIIPKNIKGKGWR